MEPGEGLNQQAEQSFFDRSDDWEAFVDVCAPEMAARTKFAILIGCLSAHRDRLAGFFGPRLESTLVCWAMDHMGSPMSDFLRWSLGREEGAPEYWTIDVLDEHLTLWSNVFESTPAKHYEEYVIRLTSSLHPYQNATNGPSITHALSSDPKHRRWAYQLWKVFWLKHFERVTKSHQLNDAEMSDTL
ncbi:hypothetical protein FOPE_09104 [Fonsecaea pedrosoi]|nr:hypothetical protein FOPE_09104 [Fonsecaea pedrosoi]